MWRVIVFPGGGVGNDEFPHRLVLGEIVSVQAAGLGRTAGLGLNPLPLSVSEPDLAASSCYFIVTTIIFAPDAERSNQPSLSICCIARVKGALLDFFKQSIPAWLDFDFSSSHVFFGPLKHETT